MPLVIFFVQVLFFAASLARAVTLSSDLDKKSIHASYTDGDFDVVVGYIEAFMSTHPTYAKDDSVFIAKHLAVIYTANPQTREMGKHYMFRLLELLPSAKIVDMFVSDEIDRIFEKVREEFIIRQKVLGKNAPTQMESDSALAMKTAIGPFETSAPKKDSSVSRSNSVPAPVAKPDSRSRMLFWVAGGGALIAATSAMTFILLSHDSHTSKDAVYDIPH